MSVHDVQFHPAIKRLLDIPDDEPIFILRAQDRFSAGVIVSYISAASASSGIEWERRARLDLESFREWQANNKVKVPD